VARREETDWRAEWNATVRESWIGPSASPAEVRAVLDALARLAPEIEKRASLADRIEKMEADQAAFRREVGIAALALGMEGEATPWRASKRSAPACAPPKLPTKRAGAASGSGGRLRRSF
jgi:hypothetical protein